MFKVVAFVMLTCSVVVADTLTVNVYCTNGSMVTNLPILGARDINGNAMDFSTPTDENGNFEIENYELYTQPFYMSYQTPDYSTCDGNYINVSEDGSGQVELNYYPTELPCSCANLNLK